MAELGSLHMPQKAAFKVPGGLCSHSEAHVGKGPLPGSLVWLLVASISLQV